MKKNFIILILLTFTGCISYPKEYVKVNSIPDYRNLSDDERIVFFEVQFTEIHVLGSEKAKVFSLILDPSKDSETKKPDFWLKYSISDNKNSTRRGIVFEFVKDYLYPDNIMRSLKENPVIESPEFYKNCPEKRMAYFKIKEGEKIRWDGIEYQDSKTTRQINRPNKELFLPLKCKKKVCYIGSYLFVSNTKYINKSSRNELKTLSLKRSDDIIKKAVEIFHIPSESEIEIPEEKNKI